MRMHLMLALAGLLSLSSSVHSTQVFTTADYVELYRTTWFASDEERSRCGDLLQQLAGDDVHAAKRQGALLDGLMRKYKCLDSYS